MCEKKYKFTDETIKHKGRILKRIEALKDFADVKRGDKGGFIEKVRNLSHIGNSWVFFDALVYGNAKVCENAKVCDNSEVGGNAIIYGNAIVCGNARIYDNAQVGDNAQVCGNAQVGDNAKVGENAKVCDNAMVYNRAEVYENSIVCSDAKVCGYATIFGNAVISDKCDYIVFKNWWSSGRHFTWTKSNNMWSVGCFYGTGKELIEKSYEDSELSGREYERVVKYVESIIKEK